MTNWWSLLIMCMIELIAVVPLLLLPLLGPRALLFGVYVPESDRNYPEVRAIRRKFAVIFALLAALGIAVAASVYAVTDGRPIPVLAAGLIVQHLGALAAFIISRRSALRLKADRKWKVPADVRRVADLRFRQKQAVLRNRWYVLQLLFVAACAGAAVLLWDRIPDPLITHYGFDGKPDRYSAKSFGIVFSLNIIQLFLVGLFAFINTVIRKSKQQLDPNRPEVSLEQQLKSRRASSIFSYILSFVIVAFFGYVQASMLYQWSGAEVFSVLLPLILLGGILGFIVYMNKKGLDEPAGFNMQDDRHWRGGVFYYNVDDPALFVAKRYGVGWTLNFARPGSWFVLAATLLLPLAIISIVILLSRS
ncbi:DUF1648 domain-containing protein [Paenibacillus hamazuiensis]|uniref:DUF1648 domain-containing protein n=1 Tax=Paenibacillus hamazuiensis TaxID=2936508 RepID=UPI00200DD470|nr:DUF5808 domain-containing protein [Paenibacillus hamazuiensis]